MSKLPFLLELASLHTRGSPVSRRVAISLSSSWPHLTDLFSVAFCTKLSRQPHGNTTLRVPQAAPNGKRLSVKMKSIPVESASSSKRASPSESTIAPDDSFPVVAIGASAGGLEAYKELFRALPVDTGITFVLIQHLDPSRDSMLAEILSKATPMPVEEVKGGTTIKPNHVYVIPPDAFMANCRWRLHTDTPKQGTPSALIGQSLHAFLGGGANERCDWSHPFGYWKRWDLRPGKHQGSKEALPLLRILERLSTMACPATPSIPVALTSFWPQKRLRTSCTGSNAIPIYVRKSKVRRNRQNLANDPLFHR